MKNYSQLLLLLLGLFGKAQIINFPDANFKANLLLANSNNTIAANLSGNYFKIDANNNGEIEVSEALNVSKLNINVQSLQSLDGILNFSNLERLNCSSNQLSSLNVSGLTKLIFLNCNDNQLTSLNVDGLMNLTTLECGYNQLNSLDISNLNKLNTLYCSNNNITSLILNNLNLFNILIADYNQLTYFDVSNINSNMALYVYLSHNNLQSYNTSNIYHETLDLTFNPNLSSLFIKDGDIYTYLHDYFMGNTNLTYICADEGEVDSINQYFQTQIIPSHPSFNCQVNSYCSFTPGGQFYTIQGQNKFDNENDGCDVTDGFFSNLKYSITDGTNTGSLISNNTGNYSIPVQTGTHTITPILENPSYFNITPTNVVVNFPTQTSPYTQNFCITPNGEIHDVEVSIIPTGVARPGFDCNYQIIFKNKGNQTENGTINLAFDDTIFDFVSTNVATSSQTFGNLNWIYSNLQPFETRSINVTLNLNSPMETPAVNADDIINLIATITSPDEIPCNNWLQSQCDNIFTLNQTVVNSYDPNGKTCLQGNTISPDRVGGFVHYMIRFENTGTFPAENIVVKDMIDTSKFDISSLIPLNASHNYITKIAGNKVEFIFENINLPFDDANNDGYVAFKIETVPTLVVGNTFSNSANIYFDYNFPIVTNTATTSIAALSNPSFKFANYISLHPNPTTNELNINLKSAIKINSIQIYNTIGQLVTVQTGNALKVDVSNLKMGNYFIKINTNYGFSASQFIKE